MDLHHRWFLLYGVSIAASPVGLAWRGSLAMFWKVKRMVFWDFGRDILSPNSSLSGLGGGSWGFCWFLVVRRCLRLAVICC